MLSSPPPHWSIRRLKSIARIVNGGTPSSTVPEYWDGNIIWLTPDDLGKLNTAYVKTGSRSITQEGYNACSTTLAPAGSIAVSTRAPIGHTAILEADACVNQGCRILVPDGTIRTRYLYRSLTALKHELETRGKGTTFAELSYGDLGTVPILVPPPAEQAAIVRYLDHADELFNRYISAKERLIDLLEEQRQAVIHQAVTRGLDPNALIKPSAVDWLGDVPQHWQMRRLKTLCTMKSGDGITTESIEPEGPYPVYGGNGIRGYSGRYTHQGNFVLIGRQGALCGNIHRASGKFWASEHAIVASLNTGHSLDWFTPLLDTMNLNQYSFAAAQPGLSVERVMNLSVPVPTPAEQENIAKYINEADDKIDSVVKQAQHQIGLANEYRTRLIADVVTGQIEVRDATVELPDQHL